MSESTALLTLVRSFYARRLTEEDYRQLSQKPSVAELASYLKRHPAFSTCLDQINTTSIHRGQLEALLRKEVRHRLNQVTRFSDSPVRQPVLRLMAMKTEIEALLLCVRLFSASPQTARQTLIAQLPEPTRSDAFPLSQLIDVHSPEALYSLLKGTPYAALGKALVVSGKEERPFFPWFQDALRALYEQASLRLVQHWLKGRERENVLALLQCQKELQALTRIYRLKALGFASPEEVTQILTSCRYLLTGKQIHRISLSEDPSAVFTEIRLSSYRRDLSDWTRTPSSIEQMVNQILSHRCHRLILFETEPSLVLIAYFLFLSIEWQNLADIIEGVRYGMDPERIRRKLVI